MRRSARRALGAAAILVIGPASLALQTDTPGFISSYDWRMSAPLFGGFSAIEVAEDGESFVALTDRGAVAEGRFIRDVAGRIDTIVAGPPMPLKGVFSDELPIADRDTEGLAIGADGSVFVAFEGIARLQSYKPLLANAVILPIPTAFPNMLRNTSLEALAIAPDGTLYAVPEVTEGEDGIRPVYRFRSGAWDAPFGLTVGDGFRPVGADIGPDGRFYLLEREFHGPGGFASRVRRFDIGGDALTNERTLFQTPAGRFGNMEGVAVWRAPSGELRMTLITDDNFLPVLGTQIIEFRVPD